MVVLICSSTNREEPLRFISIVYDPINFLSQHLAGKKNILSYKTENLLLYPLTFVSLFGPA